MEGGRSKNEKQMAGIRKLPRAAAAFEGETSRPVYGGTPSVYGKVLAQLTLESRAQARLLRFVVQDGMRKHAGRHEETFLAKIDADLARIIEKSFEEEWPGWDEEWD